MKKILIIGDVLLDREIECDPERISREAPLLIYRKINKNKLEYKLGGAGNVVSNLIGLGQSLDIYWLKGNDKYASQIEELLTTKNVRQFPILSHDLSIVKTRFFSEHKQIFRYDVHNNFKNDLKIDLSFLDKIKKGEYNYAILSDYNSNFFTKPRIKKIIDMLNAKNIKILIDPHNSDWSIYSNAHLITPNFQELCSALKDKQIKNNSISIEKEVIKLIKKYNIDNVLITRSEKGMMLVNKTGTLINLHSKVIDVIDVTGAGDTVIATIATKLNENYDWLEAVQSSNYAASIVIQKIGVASITKDELLLSHSAISSKIYKFNNKEEMKKLKNKINTKDIVFTNGAFDIIHYGHISYLLESSSMNKKFIVGINSDDSTRSLKGPKRPINNEIERSLTIASLPFVYAVVIFQETSAINLIKYLNPYIYTKGADYKNMDLVESKYAKKTIYISYKKGYSTTKIISKISKK